jgi:flavin reductase (DIM6/NTAB) family NADH-FMN oxidoreductase RutF
VTPSDAAVPVGTDRTPTAVESSAANPLRVGIPTLSVAEAAPTPRELRAAFSRYPTGVVALCAEVDGDPTGLVATSFGVGTSFDPPLATFAVQQSSTTWPTLRRADIIGVSVLADDQQEACLQMSSRTADRFAGLELARCERDDALLVTGAAMWLECRIHAEIPAGDHTLVVLEVRAIRVHDDRSPLVYHAMAFRGLADTAPRAADTTGDHAHP